MIDLGTGGTPGGRAALWALGDEVSDERLLVRSRAAAARRRKELREPRSVESLPDRGLVPLPTRLDADDAVVAVGSCRLPERGEPAETDAEAGVLVVLVEDLRLRRLRRARAVEPRLEPDDDAASSMTELREALLLLLLPRPPPEEEMDPEEAELWLRREGVCCSASEATDGELEFELVAVHAAAAARATAAAAAAWWSSSVPSSSSATLERL